MFPVHKYEFRKLGAAIKQNTYEKVVRKAFKTTFLNFALLTKLKKISHVYKRVANKNWQILAQ